MQKLVLDIKKLEKNIEHICEKLAKWNEGIPFKDINVVTKEMTEIVTLILNNKSLFEELGIIVEEENVLQAFGTITNALECKDEVLLLDGFYMEFLPWIKKIKEKIELILENE